MNEKIKDFFEDASEIFDDNKSGQAFRVTNYGMFADLIVKECSDLVQSLVDQRVPASEYPARIKEHFGVKI